MKRFTFFILAAAALIFSACDSQNLIPEIIEEKGDEPVLTTITAGFESNATKSVLDISGGYASVLWQNADSFKLYSVDSEGGYYSYDYSTSLGSPSAKADFTGPAPTALTHYIAVYPNAAAHSPGIYSSKITGFGIIPRKQTATLGSYDPAANLAFAYSPAAQGYDKLTFQNATALLKVTVTGSNVANLDSIRVQNNDYNMAGLISADSFDSDMQLSKDWVSNANSTSVTLTGSFTAGDYYIAVAPGTYNRISVVFFFRDHSYISKALIKESVSFSRSTIRNLGTFDMDGSATEPFYTYTTRSTSGETKPVTICVIPDGYVEGQQTLFKDRAIAGMDYMFSVDPYKTYKNYFNVYFLWTPSAQVGATVTDGHGVVQTAKNTAFSSKWGPGYGDMEADANGIFSFLAANCPDIVNGTLTIDDVAVLVLINDQRYGGIAHSYDNGRTYCMVPFIEDGALQAWHISTTSPATEDPSCFSTKETRTIDNSELYTLYGSGNTEYTGDWKNVLLHEFGGHSFGRLNDEYWYDSYYNAQGSIAKHSWKVPMGLNVTGTWYAGDNSKLPATWGTLKSWVDTISSSRANYSKYKRTGVYQGGDVSLFNRWRSEMISCMIDNRPYFSALQRVLIAKRIIEKSGGTFNFLSYINNYDNPDDPVRDGGGSPVMLPATKSVATSRPMLPPPVLHEVEKQELRVR